jgi:hypothetical protein
MALLGIQHRKPAGSNKALAPSHEHGHVQAGASGPAVVREVSQR